MEQATNIAEQNSGSSPAQNAEFYADSALSGFLTSARQHLGFDLAFVSRWINEDMREITHVCSEIDIPIQSGLRQQREDSFCWHVQQHQIPELLIDAKAHQFASQLSITNALPVGSHISLPLRMKDGTIWGSFCAINRSVDHTLNPRDLDIFGSFANMVAYRIEEIAELEVQKSKAQEQTQAMLDGYAVTIFQQPVHDLQSGKPVGLECLARFPDVNKRGPGAWFEDAEIAGMGPELELTAIKCALETLSSVPDQIFAAVKIPARAIGTPQLGKVLQDFLAPNLTIEITQLDDCPSIDALNEALDELRDHSDIGLAIGGVGLDFGSLQFAAQLQPNFIKMHMALTRAVLDDYAASAMISAIVNLGKESGAKIIAEGIESEAEAEAMAALGVEFGLGYHFARPLPVVAAQQHLMQFAAGFSE